MQVSLFNSFQKIYNITLFELEGFEVGTNKDGVEVYVECSLLELLFVSEVYKELNMH